MPQTWLITGTSSGFGSAFVHALLARGDNVVATARNISTIAHLEKAGAAILALDVTSPFENLQDIAEKVVQVYGGIDVLVNNAGYSHSGTVEDATYALSYHAIQRLVIG
jgi:NAD(P)-dependent dehydrogenase (short-subunit alcohol dehydrogenase family)